VGPTFDLPPGLWPVEMDRGQIGQVVQNLVLNAAQSMEHGGVVRISARNVSDPKLPGPLADQTCVRVTVADSGCGIPQADLERIFDPYFSTKRGGSGLGLAVAYSIVRKHGGASRWSRPWGRAPHFTCTCRLRVGAST